MDASRADKAQQVQSALAPVRHGRFEDIVREDVTAGDHIVDARDVHLDDTAGADTEVANLAVAHLAFGQADERAVGTNGRVRKLFPQALEIRLARRGNGVIFGIGIVTPAIHDGEDEGSAAHGG